MSAANVTVVIPCYNAERWIAATLHSVLGQQGVSVQVVLVDDGSSDHSVAVVRRAYPQVLVVQQANAGVAAARNAGIQASEGEWIAFIDADDYWLPHKLRIQLAALAHVPACGVVCSGWHVWPSDQPMPDAALLARLKSEPESQPLWGGPSGWIYPQLLLDCQVWTSTVVLRRSVLERVGGFDPDLRLGEDLDLWLRLSRETPILRVARPLALYRMHPSSITRSAPQQNWQGLVIERALRRWGLAAPDGASADPQAVRRALARTWHDFGGAQLAAGNRSGALTGALTALRHDWRMPGNWRLLARSLLPAPARQRPRD